MKLFIRDVMLTASTVAFAYTAARVPSQPELTAGLFFVAMYYLHHPVAKRRP